MLGEYNKTARARSPPQPSSSRHPWAEDPTSAASAPNSAHCGFPSSRDLLRTRRPQGPARGPLPLPSPASSGRPGACARPLGSRLGEAGKWGGSGRTPALRSRHSPRFSGRVPAPPTGLRAGQARRAGNCEGGCRRVPRMLFKVCR